MTRFLGPAGVLFGAMVIIAGLLFQAAGAAALVYCSVVGVGIVLALAGGVIWIAQARSHGTLPGAPAA